MFSYQSRGVIDSNIILMAKQDSNATPRAVEKSLSHLTKVVSEPDKGEIAAIKKRALERLQHRPRPDLFSVVYAREAFRTLVIAAFRYSQQGASYEDIAQHVSPYFPMLVKGGFTYVTYYALVMDALKSFGAQPNGKDSWTLPPGTAYPSGEDIERAKQATWRTEALPDVPLGILASLHSSSRCGSEQFSCTITREKENHGCRSSFCFLFCFPLVEAHCWQNFEIARKRSSGQIPRMKPTVTSNMIRTQARFSLLKMAELYSRFFANRSKEDKQPR